MQEAGIRDGTTIPPARRSGNGNLSGGGDDLRGAAWWLVPKGKKEREAKGAEKSSKSIYKPQRQKARSSPVLEVSLGQCVQRKGTE